MKSYDFRSACRLNIKDDISFRKKRNSSGLSLTSGVDSADHNHAKEVLCREPITSAPVSIDKYFRIVIVYAVMMIKIGSIIIFQLSSHIKNPNNFRPPIGGQYYIVLQYNIWPDPPTHPRKLRNFGMLPKVRGVPRAR